MLKRAADWMQRRGQRRREFDATGSMMAFAGLGGAGSAATARSSLPAVDRAMLAVVLALVMLGTVMVYSASIALSDSPRYNVAPTHFVVRHVLSLAIAFCAAVVAFQVPMATWQRFAPLIFACTMVLLVAVLIPGIGKGVNGARRWVPLGILNLQPSELMKVACVLYAANFTVRKQDYMHHFGKGFLPMAVVMAMIGALLLLQPDLGAFGVIGLILVLLLKASALASLTSATGFAILLAASLARWCILPAGLLPLARPSGMDECPGQHRPQGRLASKGR